MVHEEVRERDIEEIRKELDVQDKKLVQNISQKPLAARSEEPYLKG